MDNAEGALRGIGIALLGPHPIARPTCFLLYVTWVAQLVERANDKRGVAGSSPAPGAKTHLELGLV